MLAPKLRFESIAAKLLLGPRVRETGTFRTGFSSLTMGTRSAGGSSVKQRGMTLLELTVVLLILTTLATVALRSTSGLQDQARWEQTKNRYEAIRAAIIGDPKLTINGQPDISGFVADMGRLPVCLRELLEQHGYCSDTRYCTPDDCTTNDGTWTLNTAAGGGANIEYGWKGPYLLTSENAEDDDAFSDGWGQTGNGNYGWSLAFLDSFDAITTTTGNAVQMKIQSVGRDAAIDTGGETGYDLDYPSANHTIGQDDYTVDISGGISIRVIPPFSMENCKFYPSDVNAFITYESCDAAGGGWTNGSCSNSSYFTKESCELAGATWTNGSCSLDQTSCETHSWVWDSGESSCANTINSKSYCESNGGTWNFNKQLVCMKLFYRSATAAEITAESSVQFQIIENGQEQVKSFTFAISEVPMGMNAIGLYEYNLATTTCTPAKYPDSAMPKIKLPFIPRRALPVIQW